jgi:hypothetical protein
VVRRLASEGLRSGFPEYERQYVFLFSTTPFGTVAWEQKDGCWSKDHFIGIFRNHFRELPE